MREQLARCWCCGLEYRSSVLRIVRNPGRGNGKYNFVCRECQQNVGRAMTAAEEAKR